RRFVLEVAALSELYTLSLHDALPISALMEAVAVARRARTGGAPVILHVPLSRATLGDGPAAERMLAILDANRAILQGLTFLVARSEEHTSELQSRENLVCRLLLEKKK